ncbi:MAG: ribose-phosphate pyrophosphokinase [Sulfolobales archaeon]|nr:ribose-phosphate pyrophosphokinase [Sulfolobales archaeon]
MIVAGLSGANGLDLTISNLLKAKLAKVDLRKFPDGETYVRFHDDLSDENVVLIQTTYPEQDRRLVELLLSVDTAKDLGCRKVIVVAPYLAYSRQDRRFLDGEAVSIKTILKLLGSAGADYLITVDVHKAESLAYFPGKAINLSPTSAFAEALKEVVSNPVVIAPDQGALNRAAELAKQLHSSEYFVFRKFRDRVTGMIRHEVLEVDISDRDAVIIDDIVSTGTTIASIASYIRDRGASKIYVVCSHALLVGDAFNKLASSGVSKIYALNTLATPNGVEVVDTAPLISDAINNLVRS